MKCKDQQVWWRSQFNWWIKAHLWWNHL